MLGDFWDIVDYIKSSLTNTFTGDLLDKDSQTALSTVLRILLGVVEADVFADIGDFMAHTSEGNFEWIDVLAFFPVIGELKYAKSAGKMIDKVVDTSKLLELVGGITKIDNYYYAAKETIDAIGKAVAKNVDFSTLNKVISSVRKSTEGGLSSIIKYSDDQGVKFIIHQVTDAAGNIIHRDFDAVRIATGQLINKLTKR